jgi:Bacterial Ig-like domain/Secretion system C-terminal sorting domain/Carboxypeptidase regulatory-like domain
MKYLLTAVLILIFSNFLTAQDSLNNGNWANKYEQLVNTPEAGLMVRTGDIDNLGFGWPTDFDPFSGASTPSHGYPWVADTTDPNGTDRIMVITSYVGTPPSGRDGYTSGTSRPENSVRPIFLTYNLDGLPVSSAMLQIFVDDFQAPVWQAQYQVKLDGIRIPGLELIINDLVQTGPIGRIIKFQVPEPYLYLLEDDTLNVLFDDFTTGAGDGYAVDFVKLLINPSLELSYGTISGTIKEQTSSSALADVKVIANGSAYTFSSEDGTYSIDSVFTGLVTVQTFLTGYGSQTKTVILEADQTQNIDFFLVSPAPALINFWPEDSSYNVSLLDSIRVEFDVEIDSNTVNSFSFYLQTADSSIPGSFYFDSTKIVFVPDNPLFDATNYRVTLNTNIKNNAGVPLAAIETWTFSTGDPTGFGEQRILQNPSFRFYPAYPNPFNPITTLRYKLNKPGKVQLTIFDVTGKTIKTILDENQLAGTYKFRFDAQDLASGLYFAHLKSGTFSKTKKILLIK